MSDNILVSHVSSRVLQDRQWVRKTFMLAADQIDAGDPLAVEGERSFSSAQSYRLNTKARLDNIARRKFTNTQLGGNWTINNLPQFTRHADIRENGLATEARNWNTWSLTSNRHLGMGRYYSEAIDDNSQTIAMQFGMAQYNGMLSFFTGFYDNDAAVLATEGLASVTYYIGRAAGLIVGVAMFPVILLGSAASFFLSRPTSKYYYMRETMPLYWNRVNVIANSIAVNMGLVPSSFRQSMLSTNADPETQGMTLDENDASDFTTYFAQRQGDIFQKDGGINVYALATRAQRMADARYELMQDMSKEETADTLRKHALAPGYGRLRDPLPRNTHERSTPPPPPKPGEEVKDAGPGLGNHWTPYIEDYFKMPWNKAEVRSQVNATLKTDITALKAEGSAAEGAPTSTPADSSNEKGFFSKWATEGEGQVVKGGLVDDNTDTFMKHYMAARRDGGKYVYFRTDFTGSVAESFSNSFGKPEIASKINNMSSQARELRFSFSDGNTGIGVVDSALGAFKSFVAGGLDSINMSGLMSLAGAAFVDIPDKWQESTANLPSASYTIELRTPYGHRMARFINLYVPLACLLAGVLPISTGKASYTSPFMCSLFSRGRQHIRHGMIESMNVSRGVGNFGWNNNSECLAIDVTFTVKDLSSIMHAPISAGFEITKPWKNLLFDNDNLFNDYMATLGNLSLADQTYPIRKMMLNMVKKGVFMDTYFSGAHLASMLDESFLTRWAGTAIGAWTRAGEGLTQQR